MQTYKTSIFIMILGTSGVNGQLNLQHHFDVGRNIQTSTAEFFYQDNFGSTFGFMDINYDTKHFDKTGATDMWFEIARYFDTSLFNHTTSATIQYNDGIYFIPGDNTSIYSIIEPALLFGISYPVALGRNTVPVDFLIRKQHGDKRITYQITVVWFHPLTPRISFAGFMDIWTNDNSSLISVQSEPQILIHIREFDVGIEVEVSRGFTGAWTKNEEYFDESSTGKDSKIWAIPTLFIKYTF